MTPDTPTPPERQPSAKTKFRAVLDLLVKGDQSLREVAHVYHVHPLVLTRWKNRFLEFGAEIFDQEPADQASVQDTALSALLRRQAD